MNAEDRALLAEMAAEVQSNRAHNLRKMEEAGVPRAARRGFGQATSYHQNLITEITEYPREGKASRWGVFTELYPGSFTRYSYLVGPRGACTKVS